MKQLLFWICVFFTTFLIAVIWHIRRLTSRWKSPLKYVTGTEYCAYRVSEKIQDDLFVSLSRVHDALTESDVPVWLAYGTLLGAVRHGNIIPWDDDIDVEINVTDWERAKHALEAHATKHGLRMRVVQHSPTFISGSVKIEYDDLEHNALDIFFVETISNQITQNAGIGYRFLKPKECGHPTQNRFPLRTKTLRGKTFNIPVNAHAYLDAHYNEWQTRVVIDPHHTDTNTTTHRLSMTWPAPPCPDE